ncbi:MAG: lamin tail domain-containing protein [Candidatus Izemoplasmatales bacterium]|nr:lamin tail domain-containing protein [Candidatus Izemoplasmatales bacterium]
MKKAILALFVGLMFIAAPLFVKADTVTTPVSISAYFDETNSDVSSIIPPQTYGSKVSFSNHLPTAPEGYESYEFAYWIVNGVVRSDLNFNAQFRVTDHLDLVAIYRPANKYVVVFMDTNGKMIDLDYVSSGSPATAPNIDNLTKPGLVVQSLNPWSVDFSEVTNNMVVWVQYESAQEVTFDVSTTNGTGGGTGLEFGSVASVSASETSGSDVFTHWVDENGKVVSYQLSHTFTVYKDTVLTAVYGESASHLPSVVISDRMSFHSNKSSYIGQFYVAEGYELVEYGMITSMVQGSFDLETEGITRYQSNKHNGPTKEFMMSISAATSQYIRGYLVVEDDLEQLHYFYSSIEKTRDLMISEYGEGSGNNKWIEIYNPTCETIDLASYKIVFNGYTNAGASSSSTYNLTGNLLAGDVYLIANTQAVQAIKDVADVTTTSIVAFTGDDALSIYKGNILIDRFGIVGPDPGDYWEIGEGTTQDHTIIRDIGVFSPSTSWILDEWSVFGIDYFDNLGFHENNTPSSLTISGSSSVLVGNSISLSVSHSPLDSIRGVTWSSLNETLAEVNSAGSVTGKVAGVVTIRATSTADTNVYKDYEVTVIQPEEYDITVVVNNEDWGFAYADPTSVTTGQNSTIYFTAEDGYFVSTIKIGSGPDIDVKGLSSYEVENILDDITVYVTFEEGEVQLTEQVIYSTGFESSEGFTASTTYNNTAIKYWGPTDQKWGTYYGTPSTNIAISGAQSMHMRWYTSAPGNKGYAFTNFSLEDATKVTFKAKNTVVTNGINVTVSYSTDGGTNWINPETFTLSTTATDFEYEISSSGLDVMIKFQIETLASNPTGTVSLVIDQVTVYGMRP